MQLEYLYVKAFAGLKNYSLRFTEGVNVFYAPNEKGKSSILQCILALFYGFSDLEQRQTFMPWTGEKITANLWFCHEGLHYEMSRVFSRNKEEDGLQIISLEEKKELLIPEGQSPGEYFFGISRAAFERSVFIDADGSEIDFTADASENLWKYIVSTALLEKEKNTISLRHMQEFFTREVAAMDKENGAKKKLAACLYEIQLLEEKQKKSIENANAYNLLQAKANTIGEELKVVNSRIEENEKKRALAKEEEDSLSEILEEKLDYLRPSRLGENKEDERKTGLFSRLFANFGRRKSIRLKEMEEEEKRVRALEKKEDILAKKKALWQEQRAIEERILALKEEKQDYRSSLAKIQVEMESILHVTGERVDPSTLNWEYQLALEDKRKEKEAFEDAIRALELAKEIFAQKEKELEASVLPIVQKRAAFYMRNLTKERYKKLRMAEDFSLSMKDQGLKEYYPISQFSSGTKDQVYFAFRLALADYIQKGKHLPFFLDDSFLHFDEKRSVEAFSLLAKNAEEEQNRRQVLYFTCQKRMLKLVRQLPGVSAMKMP